MTTTLESFVAVVGLAAIAIICIIINAMHKLRMKKEKRVEIISSAISSVIAVLLTVIALIYPQEPEVFEDNEGENGFHKIRLADNMIFSQTLYTIDGRTNQQDNGILYDGTIEAKSGDIIIAQARFLCFWSSAERYEVPKNAEKKTVQFPRSVR